MQMTFIMQMHANQTQPSENQGWEKIYTEILNERDRVKDKSFGWQEAANRTKRRVEEQGVSQRAQKLPFKIITHSFFVVI